jgi:hypothetical protein
VPVAGDHEFKVVTLHASVAVASDMDSRTWCWGQFDGDGTQTNHLVPARLLSVRDL